jgi:hypothetical protein
MKMKIDFIKKNMLYGIVLAAVILIAAPCRAENIPPEVARSWITEMKTNERGPFKQIRWFCKNGKILPPTRTGCAGNGGGIQHGELDTRAAALRDQGYPLATLYAEFTDSDIQQIVQSPKDLAAMLLERYLVIADEGWIFRKALYYRGAMQAEDESMGAERLLLHLLNEPALYENNYLLLRESARLLAIDKDSALLGDVRSQATQLANENHAFVPIRNKLHTFPEPADVYMIKTFALGYKGAQKKTYYELADKLERVFSSSNLTLQGNIILSQLPNSKLRDEIGKALEKLNNPLKTVDIFWALSDIIYYIRKYFDEGTSPDMKRRLLIYSLHAERTLLKKWSEVDESHALKNRYDHLQFLLPVLQAAYGCGLLSERTYQAAAATVNEISESRAPNLPSYLRELRHLTRVSEWAASEISWKFHGGLELMKEIEPKVSTFVDDRLHSSLLLAYSHVLEQLLSDAAVLSGMNHYVLDSSYSSGVRALNPGLTHGELIVYSPGMDVQDLRSKIVLVENTEAMLPPVAGILTMNEGNSLSHVELLARNLGIPNAVMQGAALEKLRGNIGQDIVLAVSPAGKVEVRLFTPEWKKIFEKTRSGGNSYIDSGKDKLDLDETDLIPLQKLDSGDSGVTVGPKAARLGDLKKLFPDLVSSGLAIPFGVFNEVLQQQYSEDLTLFDWMKSRYKTLMPLDHLSPEYKQNKDIVLTTLQNKIKTTNLDEGFKKELYEAFQKNIGDPDTVGVFVRSDTNVEDLPGFTGAGLNLTVMNVVGFSKIIAAIKDVWSSPFQDRAFEWRQGKMSKPEHVYTSVLLQKTVPVEKSGVIVTSDMESGSRDYFTVAVNLGINGAVNNQQAETLVVNRENGEVKLISEGEAREKQIALLSGGVAKEAIYEKQRILTSNEITLLNELVNRVEKNFPRLKNNEGSPVPADIEFGFLRGKLYLFQIRPYLESLEAKKNNYLLSLDKDITLYADENVPLNLPLRY